jgi:hypothetical protein
MRALLTAVGTRGDVQPALALALELRTLGHAVRLCVSPNFVDQAKSLGFDAMPMGVEMRMPRGASGKMPALTPEELRRLRDSMHRRCGGLCDGRRREPRRSLPAGRGGPPSRRRGYHGHCGARRRPPGHHAHVRRPVLLGQSNRNSRGGDDDSARRDDARFVSWRNPRRIGPRRGGSSPHACRQGRPKRGRNRREAPRGRVWRKRHVSTAARSSGRLN